MSTIISKSEISDILQNYYNNALCSTKYLDMSQLINDMTMLMLKYLTYNDDNDCDNVYRSVIISQMIEPIIPRLLKDNERIVEMIEEDLIELIINNF